MSSDYVSSGELVPRFNPDLVQARWILGGLTPEDLVSQALWALQQDFSGISLQQIAGLVSPTVWDLGTLPERAFAEMGLKPIDRQGTVDILVAHGGLSSGILRSLLIAFPAFSDRWRKHTRMVGW